MEDTFTLLPGPGPGWMAAARTDFAGVLLVDGTVLVVGGFNLTTYPPGAEVWSPPSGPFNATGSMVTGRRYLTATRLANDTVLVAGGRNAAGALATAETYDAFEGIFVPTGPMSTARQSATATLLLSGQVLIAGGLGSSGYLTGAEVYGAGNFSATGSLNVARAYQTATLLLPTGEVLIAGGLGSSGYLAGAEIRDPTSGVFTMVPPMSIPRSQQTATVLLDGRVLVVGGSNGSSALDSADNQHRAEDGGGLLGTDIDMAGPCVKTPEVVADLGSGEILARPEPPRSRPRRWEGEGWRSGGHSVREPVAEKFPAPYTSAPVR